jgi:hypothetical protein
MKRTLYLANIWLCIVELSLYPQFGKYFDAYNKQVELVDFHVWDCPKITVSKVVKFDLLEICQADT